MNIYISGSSQIARWCIVEITEECYIVTPYRQLQKTIEAIQKAAQMCSTYERY